MKVRRIDFSPDEFLVGTRQLTDAEVGMYWRACSLIYSHGGPIPIEELQRWCRCGPHFNATFKRLVSYGKLQMDEGLINNKRSIEELLSARKRVLNATLNGSKGGRPRKKINEIQNPEVSSRANHQLSLSKNTSDTDVSDGADKPREPTPYDPVKEIWDRGLAMLGGDNSRNRSLLGQLIKKHDKVAVLEAIIACESERPVNPPAYLIACLKNSTPRENGHAAQRSPVEKLWSGAKLAFEEFDRRQGDSGSGGPSAGPLLDRK